MGKCIYIVFLCVALYLCRFFIDIYASTYSSYANKIPGFSSHSRRCLGDFRYPLGPAVTKKRGAGNPFLQFPLPQITSIPRTHDNEVTFQLNWPLFTRYFHGSYVFHYANGNGLFSPRPFLYRPPLVHRQLTVFTLTLVLYSPKFLFSLSLYFSLRYTCFLSLSIFISIRFSLLRKNLVHIIYL